MEHNEKQYTVLISPGVNDRMAEHFIFLAEVNAAAASRLLDTLLQDIRSLSEHPFRAPVYERDFTPAGKYRYLLSAKRYRIVYTIEGDVVYVDDIQDCRQEDGKSLLAP
ncbi:type II toxin-antitoxin system RelE/ParE family toxin [Ruminococcaceae bacterium OttesenSCG-928-A16]|nr:type II toxin-antitoxin system RelE/ParE family toxin [Ruminococcaceae bacterium OttesenSCG-928-A16]